MQIEIEASTTIGENSAFEGRFVVQGNLRIDGTFEGSTLVVDQLQIGEKAKVKGINTEGLKRRGFTPEQVKNVRRAYRTLYRSGLTLDEARDALGEMAEQATEIQLLVDFLSHVERGIIR